MTISFTCPSCRVTMELDEMWAGRVMACPNCGETVTVPAELSPESAAAGREEELASFSPSAVQPPRRPRRLIRRLALLTFFAACVAGLVFIAWFLKQSSQREPARLALSYVPDNSDFVAHVNVRAILDSPVFRSIQRENPDFLAMLIESRTGQPLAKSGDEIDWLRVIEEDVETITVGAAGGRSAWVAVVQMRRDYGINYLLTNKAQASLLQEAQGNRVVHLTADKKFAICFVDSRTMLYGQPAALRRVLSREGEPQLSPAMKDAIEDADFTQHVALAVDGGGALGAMASAGAGAKGVQGGSLSGAFATDLDLSATLTCLDPETAKQVEEQFKLFSGFSFFAAAIGKKGPPQSGLEQVLNSIELSANGPKLHASATIPNDLLRRWANDAGN